MSSLPTRASSAPARRLIHVVDDDIDVRNSLEYLLTTREIAVTSFVSGPEFFAALPGLSAAPILLDFHMPRMDGLQFLDTLTECDVDWPVIVMTGHGSVNVAVKAIRLGAMDFLEKPVMEGDLNNSIERAFATLGEQNGRNVARQTAAQLLSKLTPREAEVLEWLCKGRSNKQVAFDLAISSRTVEMHRANALRNLGVRSIAEVVGLKNSAPTNTTK